MTPRAQTNQSHAMRATIALTTSLTILSFAAAPAVAGKRAPAPITFAGQGGRVTAPAPQSTPTTVEASRLSQRERRRAASQAKRVQATTATAATTPGGPTRRVEFRYPDQPDTFYGANGARAATDAAPLSFSSSTSAISQAEAAKYTVGSPPATVANVPLPKDPAITSGGFDARAAAARNAATPPTPQPVLVSSAGPADFSSTPLESSPRPVIQNAVATRETPATRPVSGAVFQPEQDAVYDRTGTASVFDPVLNGQPTSTGEILDTQAMVAAHPSLPLPSLVQIINLDNDREIVVRVNDRGPIGGNGLIEVSERAADVLGFAQTGQANVRVKYLGKAPQLSAPEEPVIAPKAPISAPELPRPVRVAAPVPAHNPLFSAPSRQSAPISAPPVSNSEQFVVQLASFSDISNAQRLYTSLGTQVGNLGIIPVQVGGTDYFRVVAGPLGNRKAAESLRDQLANQGVGRGLVIAAP